MSSSLAIQLAGVMIKLHDENSKVFKEILVTGTVHRSIMLSIYGLLTRDGSLVEIESLSKEEKEILWKRCHEIIDGRLSKEHCIEMVKAIHTLDLISQQ